MSEYVVVFAENQRTDKDFCQIVEAYCVEVDDNINLTFLDKEDAIVAFFKRQSYDYFVKFDNVLVVEGVEDDVIDDSVTVEKQDSKPEPE